MLPWEKNIPDFLTERRNIVIRILFTAAFALIFINIYAPLGVNTWFNISQLELFLYSSALILTGLLVMVISRIIMFQISRRHKLSYLQYGSWELMELMIMALAYTLLKIFFLHEATNIVDDYIKSLEITVLVVFLPYIILMLYFSWYDKVKKFEKLSHQEPENDSRQSKLLPFYDEKNVMRFSMMPSDILYLESADNYVNIFYLSKQKVTHYLLRNSLKKLETYLEPYSFIRCHRSYIVNFEKVKLIRKDKDSLKLELDAPSEVVIPVSKTYSEGVLNEFVKTGN